MGKKAMDNVISYTRNMVFIVLTILFGSTCAIGYVINGERSSTAVLGVAVIEGILFYFILRFLYTHLSGNKNLEKKLQKSNNIIDFFECNTWLKIFVVLLLVWIPWVIIRYPGVKAGGVDFQIQQFMGLDTRARWLSEIVYEDHYITGHHPVLLTCFFGMFVKFGVMMGNPNLGLFCLSVIVCCINAYGWSWVLKTIKQYIYPKGWFILFLVFTLNPLIMSLNSGILKDNLFATILAVYSLRVLMFLQSENDEANLKYLLIISMVVPFIKNQGIYIVIITTIILLICKPAKVKKLMACIILPILVFNVMFQGILMPALKIAPGGRQEMLSICFQTVAGAINDHPEIIESEEYEAINKVLPLDDWSVYEPENADDVKFRFNQNSTSQELVDFFEAWLKIGIKYPKSYLKAFVLQTYGYYCIDSVNDWRIEGHGIVVSVEGDEITDEYFQKTCTRIYSFLDFCAASDRTKYLFSIPFALWLILCSGVIYRGKNRELLWIVPILVQWLICLVSPVNASGRYGMVIYELAPCFIAYVVCCKQNFNSNLEEKITG